MAIAKPILLYPSGVKNVDPASIITVLWRASSPQTDYMINVYKVSDNSNIYTSTKLTSTNLFHDIPINTLSAYTNEGLYITVTVYNSLDEATSNNENFQVNNLPTFTIDAYPNPILKEDYTFSFTYSQADSIQYKTWKFLLYDVNSDLISESEYLYSYDSEKVNIYNQQYEATNLTRGGSFKIEFKAITEADQEVSTGLQSVIIDDYVVFPDTPKINVVADNSNGYIETDYEKYKVIQATTIGTTSFEPLGKFNEAIELDTLSSVTITENIPKNFTLSWYYKMPHNFNGKMLEIQDNFNNIELGYEDNKFYYIGTDLVRYETDIIIPYTMEYFETQTWEANVDDYFGDYDDNYTEDWAFVTLTNNKLYIKLDTPLQTLAVNWDIDLKSTSEHSSTVFYGKQLIDHIHAYNTVFTTSQMELFNIDIETAWGTSTEYLAKFNNDLEAGRVIGGSGYQGVRLKRQTVGETVSITIADLLTSTSDRTFKDLTTKNKTPYVYSIAVVNDNGEGTYQLSEEVQNDFFGAFLLSEDNETIYHFNAGFDGGLALSPIVRNFDHHIYENYDRVPIVSTSVKNYASSGLNAFIYKEYTDGTTLTSDNTMNIDMSNGLESFITDGNTKIYKDYLKNIFKISTYGFIKTPASTMGLDLYSSISFEWVEVGDIS